MARPPKAGLSYSAWDCNVLGRDDEIADLIRDNGPAGFLVYFYLCQQAYGNEGYYYPWNKRSANSAANRLGGGIKPATVEQVVRSCLKSGLFDKALFEEHRVLTSRAIQRGYLNGIKRRSRKVLIITEYWLLETENVAGVVFMPLNSSLRYANTDLDAQKPSFGAPNDTTQDGMKGTPPSPPQNFQPGQPSRPGRQSPEERRDIVYRCICQYESSTQIRLTHNKETYRLFYELLDRGYTERDIKAIINKAVNEYGPAQVTAQGAPVTLGRILSKLSVDLYIQGDEKAETAQGHPEWARDHYKPLPLTPQQMRRLGINGYQG